MIILHVYTYFVLCIFCIGPVSQACKPGHFKVGDSCLFLSTFNSASEDHRVNWKVAPEICAQHAGRPAMLKTPQLMSEALDLLRKYVNTRDTDILIGLQNASPLLPLR
jgi:hypothetical protein